MAAMERMGSITGSITPSIIKETRERSEKDNNLEKKLHDQHNRPERQPYPRRDTPLEAKKQRIKYAKQQIMDNTPDQSVVMKYAVELIKYTGIFCHEVTELCIKDVIKAEYLKRDCWMKHLKRIWIVDEIAPLPVKYPKGSKALSIRLSNDAKESYSSGD